LQKGLVEPSSNIVKSRGNRKKWCGGRQETTGSSPIKGLVLRRDLIGGIEKKRKGALCVIGGKAETT